ncbi:MAG: hypothetical protein HY560_04220 [Gemmatimonadetes bacterium]|nr:hypothetical protein [Gemmatimonadota bacterium]
MSTALSPGAVEHRDVRTIVGGGVKLGGATVVGVVLFALLSRVLTGRTETVIQSAIVLEGGALASYLPAFWVRPRSLDAIGWTTLLGFLGAVVFTVIDTAVLRPVKLYHWTWDAIGGGSGWWYIPVWWMGSAFLSWLGGLIFSYRARAGEVNVVALAGQTVGIGFALSLLLVLLGIAPFHSAIAALGFGLGLVIHVPVTLALNRR